MRCPVVVGRDEELIRLEEVVTAARAGAGGAVGIVGEPGIGKSRLAREMVAMAQLRGFAVARGRAAVEHAGMPYRALVDTLAAPTRGLPVPTRGPLVPYLAVLGLLVPAWRDPGWMQPVDHGAFVGEALVRLLEVLAEGSGVLFVVEDLHWADADTIDAVGYLADHARELSAAVCVTARPRQDHGPSVVDRLRAADATVLALERLDRDASGELLRAAQLDEAAIDAVVDGADGLPLALEDLAAGDASRFVDNVAARVARLGDEEQHALAIAALLGDTPDWEVVDAASRTDGASLRRAACALDVLASGDRGVGFRHALTREAVLQALPADERATLAAVTAGALVRMREPALERDLLAAALLVDAGRARPAAQLLLEAGRRALDDGSYADAGRALSGAAALVGTDRDLRLEVDRVHARALLLAGRPAAAADVAASILATTDGRDSAVAVEAAVLSARAAIAMGRWDAARVSLDTGRRGAVPEFAAELAVLDVECALSADGSDERVSAEYRARAAVALAEESGDPALECEARELLGRCVRLRDLDAAADELRGALAVAERHGLGHARLRVLNELGTVEMLTDARPDRLVRARAEALRAGALGLAASAGLNLASARVMTSDLAGAEAVASEVAVVAGRVGLVPLQAACELMLGAAAGFAGDDARREEHLREAERLGPDDADLLLGVWAIGRGLGALVDDDRDRARRAFDRARSLRPERQARILDASLGPGLLLDAAAGSVAPEAIRRAWSGEIRGARWTELWLGAALAVALGHAGESDAAVAALSAALDAGDRFPLFSALVRRIAGEAAVERGFADPVPLLRDAEAAFTALGLARLRASTSGLLRQLGEAAPRRRGPADAVPPWLAGSGVTSREAEVLALLADRLTNREIGERLFISTKTVEKHVAALARKLVVARRAELAELARARRTD